ncbi:hypothetical protein N7462_003678 [Penicillium macrosclerotiorum]|uniref:uncharacterized protein n=1 Tax=Penicillium macrosclerotiorum TaxID=303699 RepID=UPI0025474A06|nr:uncharacterized protein N7462_003678 [Penicillium macrosclerotiorum]KAJ5689286.1 hypothetical protein N7462_003678 [Penicillium macrosclerotiorum]
MPNDREPEDKDNDHKSSGMPQDSGWEGESNPFVAFRRFADEQVSSVLQSITGLPSSISPPQPDHWTIFTDDKGYKSMQYRQRSAPSAQNAEEQDKSAESSKPDQGAEGNSPATGSSSGDSKSSSQILKSRFAEDTDQWNSQSQSQQSWRNRPSDFFGVNSLFDRLEDHIFPFAMNSFHPRRFFFPELFDDSNAPTWPISYIMFSPYSPLHLERQQHSEKGVFSSIMSTLRHDTDHDSMEPQWREAFEDLLRLENGKPMLDDDDLAATKAEDGRDWLQGLVKRGSLGDRWNYVRGTKDQPWSGITFTGHRDNGRELLRKETSEDDKEKVEAEQKEAENELELYERFLHDIEARERELSQEVLGSPLLRFLLEERRRNQAELERFHTGLPQPEERQDDDETQSWLNLVSGGIKKSVPDVPVTSTPDAGAATEDSVSEMPPGRIVSTMSRTERVRLADGSIQIRIVKTKRFADGREETDSTVEVTHPRSEHESLEPENGDKSKNGWFWKD